MATIVGVALPFFAVLLCGMLAARLRLLDDAGLIGLNAFVFWFALPALLFQKVATTAFERLTDWTLYVGYEGSCLLLYFVVLAAVRWLARRSLREAAICAFAASWGNVGYMGVPLLIAAYGEASAVPGRAGGRPRHAGPAERHHPAAGKRRNRRQGRAAGGRPGGGAQPADPGRVRGGGRGVAEGGAASAGDGISEPARAGRRVRRTVRAGCHAAWRSAHPGQEAGRRRHPGQAAAAASAGMAGAQGSSGPDRPDGTHSWSPPPCRPRPACS